MTAPHARTAVITGAGGSVGSAVVEACVADGFDVHAVFRRAPAATAAGVTAHAADLEDDDELGALIASLAAVSHMSLLVHAAGAYERAALADTGDAALARLLRVNVQAPHTLTRGLLPALRAGGANVVFVNSSVAVRAGEPDISAYAASRHAQRSLADSLRSEENAHGVRVTSLFLGRTAGPLQERIHADEGRRYEPQRLVQPQDVAQVVLGLASLPATSEITELQLRPRLRPA